MNGTQRSQGLEDPSPKGVATFCVTTDSDDLLHSPLPNTAETNGSKQGRWGMAREVAKFSYEDVVIRFFCPLEESKR